MIDWLDAEQMHAEEVEDDRLSQEARVSSAVAEGYRVAREQGQLRQGYGMAWREAVNGGDRRGDVAFYLEALWLRAWIARQKPPEVAFETPKRERLLTMIEMVAMQLSRGEPLMAGVWSITPRQGGFFEPWEASAERRDWALVWLHVDHEGFTPVPIDWLAIEMQPKDKARPRVWRRYGLMGMIDWDPDGPYALELVKEGKRALRIHRNPALCLAAWQEVAKAPQKGRPLHAAVIDWQGWEVVDLLRHAPRIVADDDAHGAWIEKKLKEVLPTPQRPRVAKVAA